MKQHKSVLQLFVRSSFHQVLAVCLLMAAVEFVWFQHMLKKLTEQWQAEELRFLTAEVVFEESNLLYVFMVAIAILTIFLRRIGSNIGGRQEYTLYRLRIEPKHVFLWQALYNSCCYVLLWAVQVVVAFGLCTYFVRTADASMVTNQSLFLAFYRSDFLHAVLPLESVFGWISIIFWYVALGWSVAYDSYRSRRGKHSIWLYVILILGYMCCACGLEETPTKGIVALLYVMCFAVVSFLTLKEGEWTLDGE